MSVGNYDGAIAALSAAARVRRTTEVETLLNQALVDNARATAAKNGDQARLALERQLEDERTRRVAAEAEAKRNQDLYGEALKLAQKAQAAKNYTVARAKYEEAGKLFRTDAVLTGLRQVETGQAQTLAEAQAAKQKALDEQQKADRIKQFLTQGQTAFDSKQYDAAVKALRQAKKLAPDNIDVLTALTRAEQANEKAQAEARLSAAENDRQKNFQRLLDSGKANLANKQFDAAKLALTQALVLKPGDPDATTSLQAVDKALSTVKLDAGAKEAAEKKAASYQKFMDEGRLALSTKRVDDAIRAFSAAQKLVPGDKASQGFLLDAQKAKQDADAAAALAAQKQAEEVKRAAALQKALTDGRAALAAKNLDAAAKAFNAAQTLAPGNPDVARALADLKQAQQAVQADAAMQQKRLADFNQFVKQG